MAEAIIVFLDSARGQYIPRDFAQSIKRETVSGIDLNLLDLLAAENSETDEFYWKNWESVLNNCTVSHDGNIYRLHHDGDLFLVCDDLMTENQKRDFYGDF